MYICSYTIKWICIRTNVHKYVHIYASAWVPVISKRKGVPPTHNNAEINQTVKDKYSIILFVRGVLIVELRETENKWWLSGKVFGLGWGWRILVKGFT